VKKDVAAAIIRPEKTKTLGIEVRDHRTGLFPGGHFPGRIGGVRRGLRRATRFVAYALFNEGQIVFSQFSRDGVFFRRHFETRIPLASLFK
jgi:hypothetical protein